MASLITDNGLPVLTIDGERVVGDEWLDEAESVCVSFPDVENGYASAEFTCDYCGETFESRGEAEEHSIDEHGSAGGPEMVTERNPWINSASIHFKDDEVTVCISCGDPRGAFCMTLRNVDGELFLSVPHPEQSYLHRSLVEQWPGSYKVAE